MASIFAKMDAFLKLIWHVIEPATFVAAFNHEDPGVTSLAQRCRFVGFTINRLLELEFQILAFLRILWGLHLAVSELRKLSD